MEANREYFRAVSVFTNYEISSVGRVRNSCTGRIMKLRARKDGYLDVSLAKNGTKKRLLVHRLVADAFLENPVGKLTVDHIDSNRGNNNWENLRPATCAENNRNRCKRANASSSYYGVSWVKKREKWTAQISINGTVVNLGSFSEEKEAAAVFNTAAIEHYGVFAKLNDLTGV